MRDHPALGEDGRRRWGYTKNDSPAVVQRIEKDLERIRSLLLRSDPHLRSLVLTGGFGRGEGMVVDGEPQNDYDLVAIRGVGRSRVPYAHLRASLEAELGLHVDLAPVTAWRLRFVSPSIFWYETSLRNRVLWGEDLMGRVPVRDPAKLDPAEALRLLVNRAAGLLLATGKEDAHAHRIQASKALLAAMDVHLLARGEYPPSHRERWAVLSRWREENAQGDLLRSLTGWLDWAYAFKVEPDSCGRPDPVAAWRAAAGAVLGSVPVALQHAGLGSLDEYARRDGLTDHVCYWVRPRVPGTRRFVRHPTGRVRVATIRLLETSLDGVVRPADAKRVFAPLVRDMDRPLGLLEGLRAATLQ